MGCGDRRLRAAAWPFVGYAVAAGAPLSVRSGSHTSARAARTNLAQAGHGPGHQPLGIAGQSGVHDADSSGVTSFWHTDRSAVTRARARPRPTRCTPQHALPTFARDGLTVLALTSHPASVSVSAAYSPPTWHVGFDPQSFDRIMQPGTTVSAAAATARSVGRPDPAGRRAGQRHPEPTSGRRGVVSLRAARRAGAGHRDRDQRAGPAKVIIRGRPRQYGAGHALRAAAGRRPPFAHPRRRQGRSSFASPRTDRSPAVEAPPEPPRPALRSRLISLAFSRRCAPDCRSPSAVGRSGSAAAPHAVADVPRTCA